MTLYSRHQLIVLLVLLSAAGFGLAVGHWRRAHPDVVERLEQFDRTPPPAGSLAPPARFPASPERGHPRATPRSARQTSRAARIDLNRADVARSAGEHGAPPPRGRDVGGGGLAPRRRRGRRRPSWNRGAPAPRPRRPPRSAADRARGWAARRRAGLVGPRSRPSPHRGRARRRPRALGTDPGDRVRRGATARPRPADHGRAAPPPRARLPQSRDVRLR